jgi:hypothetical protein
LDESLHAVRAGAGQGRDDGTGALHLPTTPEAPDGCQAHGEPELDQLRAVPRHDRAAVMSALLSNPGAMLAACYAIAGFAIYLHALVIS